jgi:hypothetical protein
MYRRLYTQSRIGVLYLHVAGTSLLALVRAREHQW